MGHGVGASRDPQHLDVPNEAARARDMRHFVGDFLAEAHVADDVSDDVLMAIGEVVANACRHGRRPSGGRIQVRVQLADVLLCVSVRDDGPGFDVDRVLHEEAPDLLSQGGRGFFLMRQLMDRVDVQSSDRGTTVTLERALTG